MAKAPRAFLIGWPIEHSRSPVIHGYWLKEHGLSGEYTLCPYQDHEFEGFLNDRLEEGFIGGNVTMPHKEKAFLAAEILHPTAKALGALNTVWMEDGKLHGENTDGYGFLANLDDRAPGWDSKDRQKRGAVVFGAGGAARAIIYSLVKRGFNPVIIANRTLPKAQELATNFGPSCQAVGLYDLPEKVFSVSLVVNTTPLGMEADKSAPISAPVDLAKFSNDTIVSDIVYTPLMTPLLQQAERLGLHHVDGLGMLLHQAVPGFEHWFGVRPEVTKQLRDHILQDIGEDH